MLLGSSACPRHPRPAPAAPRAPHCRRRLTWPRRQLGESGRVGAPGGGPASARTGLGRGDPSGAAPSLARAREPRPPRPLRCPGGGWGRRGPAPRCSRAGGSRQGWRGGPSPRPGAGGWTGEGGGGVLFPPKGARARPPPGSGRAGVRRPLPTWPRPAPPPAVAAGSPRAGSVVATWGPGGHPGRLAPPRPGLRGSPPPPAGETQRTRKSHNFVKPGSFGAAGPCPSVFCVNRVQKPRGRSHGISRFAEQMKTLCLAKAPPSASRATLHLRASAPIPVPGRRPSQPGRDLGGVKTHCSEES